MVSLPVATREKYTNSRLELIELFNIWLIEKWQSRLGTQAIGWTLPFFHSKREPPVRVRKTKGSSWWVESATCKAQLVRMLEETVKPGNGKEGDCRWRRTQLVSLVFCVALGGGRAFLAPIPCSGKSRCTTTSKIPSQGGNSSGWSALMVICFTWDTYISGLLTSVRTSAVNGGFVWQTRTRLLYR